MGAVREKEVGQMDSPSSLVGWDAVESEGTLPWWLPLQAARCLQLDRVGLNPSLTSYNLPQAQTNDLKSNAQFHYLSNSFILCARPCHSELKRDSLFNGVFMRLLIKMTVTESLDTF